MQAMIQYKNASHATWHDYLRLWSLTESMIRLSNLSKQYPDWLFRVNTVGNR